MNHDSAIGLWEPPIGARIRIGFGKIETAIHGVLWIQLSKDASLYLGIRNPDFKSLKMGSKRTDGGDVFIGYDEGDPIEDSSILKNPKLSFHASGVVHAGGKRSFRTAFRGLDRRELVCQVLLQNPNVFPFLEKIKKYDICLNYPISDEYPVLCNIYISPLDKKYPPLIMKGAKYHLSVILAYQRFANSQDIAIQLSFFHMNKGPWPPYTYIIWKGGEARENGKPL